MNNGKMLKDKKYFAAANSKDGFKSYFGEIFSPELFENIYIIKGGPGTGKSRLMSELGDMAIAKGYNVEYYLCSSDTQSLDGIIINELNTCIIDGTSPHLIDPLYPGAVEIILNLGDFFDIDNLKKNKDKIKELSKIQKRSYEKVYGFLCCAGLLQGQIDEILKDSFYFDKLRACVRRLSRDFQDGGGYSDSPRLISAFGTSGKVTLDTFERYSEKQIMILESYGTSYIIFDEIKNMLKEKNHSIFTSYTSLDSSKINGIISNEAKCAFLVTSEYDDSVRDKYCKVINMDRFIDREKISQNKNKLRFLAKAYRSITEEAELYLKNIRTIHNDIEQIYIESMDFDKKEAFVKELAEKIFD